MVIGGCAKRYTAHIARFANVGRIAKLAAAGFPNRERCLGTLGDQPSLLLGERGIQVQHATSRR